MFLGLVLPWCVDIHNGIGDHLVYQQMRCLPGRRRVLLHVLENTAVVGQLEERYSVHCARHPDIRRTDHSRHRLRNTDTDSCASVHREVVCRMPVHWRQKVCQTDASGSQEATTGCRDTCIAAD